MVFEYSTLTFLHGLILELLIIKTDTDFVMLFQFNVKYAKLNFKTMASMQFGFYRNPIIFEQGIVFCS